MWQKSINRGDILNTKETRKFLSKKLFKFNWMKQRILNREDELLNNAKTDINSFLRSKNKIGRTTEDMAIIIAEDPIIRYYRSWIDAIDELQIFLLNYPDELRIIRYRYIENTEELKDKDVMKKLQLKGEYPDYKSQYYNYKNNAFDLFEKICIKRHLIDIPVDNS